ncbi:hypothetical protein PYCCODRAFT_1464961 [Trametes coccinea BRFM310]|uniref:Uncharacterized protein n=1 Tax=Trametes coccinea (strain BRFM310) TaxID=1353009 RepID=A0A1Y2IWX0_TRAC3|nr:hypothetical protein PYCCODRAFT_1464961 [Trametes coccinea BRFM310]
MAPSYPEEDSLSESSMEDGLKGSRDAQHIPLLPFRSWSPSVLKETFSPTAGSFAWRAPTRIPYALAARRRTVLLMLVLIAAAGSIPLMLSSRLGARELEQLPQRLDMNPPLVPVADPSPAAEEAEEAYPEDGLPEHLRPEMWLEGEEATEHVRDSLRNDTGYVTSFLSAGWTNDQITIGNLIYLGMITDRVPILPPFTSYIDAVAQPLPFSEIFDVPRLARAINTPILEWHMVKDVERAHAHASRDHIGCWNIWEVDHMFSDGPRGSYSTALLALDISYTRAPASVKLIPGYEHDSHSSFWSLAKLAFPDGRAEALSKPDENPTRPSEGNQVILPPDEQLLCYDYLYYVCALEPFEFEKDYSPLWREVMVHAHWTPFLEDLARQYLRRLFRLPPNADIPPFIAIHARRGDFADWCGTVPQEDCFPSLGAFARRVDEVREEARLKHGVEARHVIMTGNEKDPMWWRAVEERGWLKIDHDAERTGETYGNWYPVVLDAVVQSMAIGFVGTDRSTFSHMARRRVDDWNNGASRLVKWGYPGADDH